MMLTILGAGIGILYAIYHLFILIGDGLSSFIEWLQDTMTELDAVVIVALITGAVSIIGVVLSSVVSKILEYKQKRREYLCQKREEPYSEFIEVVYKIQQKEKGIIKYSDDEMIADLYKFNRKLTLWGSDRVIKKWVEFREKSSSGTSNQEILLIVEKILYEMRKDMGLRKLGKGMLLSFFVNDIKDYIKKK